MALIALFYLLSAGWLAAPLLALAQPAPPARAPIFGERTAIVLLGGGTVHDDDGRLVPPRDVHFRIDLSARLFARCQQHASTCRVILSGGNPQKHEMAEADNYLPYLLAKAVPPADVIVEDTSLNTYQNARNVRRIIDAEHFDTLLLVTSAYQMPRALLNFDRFGMHAQPLVSNRRAAELGVLPRFANLESAETALHELIGIAQFHVYRRIGWF